MIELNKQKKKNSNLASHKIIENFINCTNCTIIQN